jgi:hypothetical protein
MSFIWVQEKGCARAQTQGREEGETEGHHGSSLKDLIQQQIGCLAARSTRSCSIP